MKKINLLLCAVLILPMIFLFAGCTTDTSDLDAQIETLQEEIAEMSKAEILGLEDSVSFTVAKGSFVYLMITDNGGFLSLSREGDKSFSIDVKYWNGFGFTSYDQVSGDGYITPAEGVYQLEITDISDADKMVLNVLLSETSPE